MMAVTRVRLAAQNARWLELPTVWDVDTPADLSRLAADVRFSQLLAGLTPHAIDGAGKTDRTTSII